MAKGNRVRPDTERGTPLFGDGPGEANHSSLGEGVVRLASALSSVKRVAMVK